jgi:hypothetical protein
MLPPGSAKALTWSLIEDGHVLAAPAMRRRKHRRHRAGHTADVAALRRVACDRLARPHLRIGRLAHLRHLFTLSCPHRPGNRCALQLTLRLRGNATCCIGSQVDLSAWECDALQRSEVGRQHPCRTRRRYRARARGLCRRPALGHSACGRRDRRMAVRPQGADLSTFDRTHRFRAGPTPGGT